MSLGGDFGVYPEELRIIAQRTSVHSALCEMAGGIRSLRVKLPTRRNRAGVIVAIPERMLARHASDIELGLPPALRLPSLDESISSVVDFLARRVGIEVYPSPPRSLMRLARRFRGSSWVLDIDVDCMEEMQEECYTRIINPGPGVLQSERAMLRFIESSRPEIITISEAKVRALRDSSSRVSGFIASLEEMGYKTEERGVYASDREVLRGISVCREFYRTVSRPLMIRHMDSMMAGDLEAFEEEEAKAARAFFTGKGYRPGRA